MMRKFIQKITGNYEKLEMREKICAELQKLENGARWFIEDNIVTMK
ncbi:MAG: hypothetical protein AAB674_02395 [Patescibacteria group bacterium]